MVNHSRTRTKYGIYCPIKISQGARVAEAPEGGQGHPGPLADLNRTIYSIYCTSPRMIDHY